MNRSPKYTILLALLVLTAIACNNPENQIIGKWTYVSDVEFGKERSRVAADVTREIEFNVNGEINHFTDGKKDGMNWHIYQVRGDTLIVQNKKGYAYENNEVRMEKCFISFKNKQMKIFKGEDFTLYERSKN